MNELEPVDDLLLRACRSPPVEVALHVREAEQRLRTDVVESGIPARPISSGMVTYRSVSSALQPGGWAMTSTSGGTGIRVGLDGQLLEGKNPGDEEDCRQDEDEYPVSEGYFDEASDYFLCSA